MFGRQLTGVCRVVGLVPPIFRGRMIPSNIPNVHRWEIETHVLPRAIGTPTEPILYTKVYTTWETGLLLATREILSRICAKYYEMLPLNSIYREFGRRNANGLPYWSDEDRKKMRAMELHLEDLEVVAHRTETVLRAEMRSVDRAKELIEKQKEVIAIAEELAAWKDFEKKKLMEANQKLEAENLKLKNKVERQESLIAALQEQSARLVQETAEGSSSQKRRKIRAATEFLSRIKDE